jgi:hypothetical protein
MDNERTKRISYVFIVSTTTILYVTVKVLITCVLMRESLVKLTVVAAP